MFAVIITKKYEELKRREPPKPTTAKEIAEYFPLKESDVEKMKNMWN
jgi:hypothetical protein